MGNQNQRYRMYFDRVACCRLFHMEINRNKPNRPMDRIPMPAALLSHILLAQAARQKQVGIGHRGRWVTKYSRFFK